MQTSTQLWKASGRYSNVVNQWSMIEKGFSIFRKIQDSCVKMGTVNCLTLFIDIKTGKNQQNGNDAAAGMPIILPLIQQHLPRNMQQHHQDAMAIVT